MFETLPSWQNRPHVQKAVFGERGNQLNVSKRGTARMCYPFSAVTAVLETAMTHCSEARAQHSLPIEAFASIIQRLSNKAHTTRNTKGLKKQLLAQGRVDIVGIPTTGWRDVSYPSGASSFLILRRPLLFLLRCRSLLGGSRI
eukprot:1810231-Amphidinium_carterae.1